MLVSLSDMKAYLGISSGDTTYDAFLTTWLTVASDAVELYCRRKFAEATYEETFYSDDYPPQKSLKLFHFPLTDLIDIELDDVAMEDIDEVRENKGSGMLYYPPGFFGANCKKMVVNYKAGYVTIPSIIDIVVKSIVQEKYNKKKLGIDVNFGNNIQRMSIPTVISMDFDYSLTTNEENSELGSILGSYQNMLTPYRSERTIIGTGKAVFIV